MLLKLVMTGEDKSPLLPVVEQSAHHKQLTSLLDRLDPSLPSHQALILALQKIYQENPTSSFLPENSPLLHNYQPLSGVENGYPQIDILTALDSLKDPYDIFPAIDSAVAAADTNEPMTKIIAKTITSTTGIPTVWGIPGTFHDPNSSDPIQANMVPVGDGLYVYDWANESSYTYYGNQGQIERQVLTNGQIRYESTGQPAIILNEARLNDPTIIQTPAHELGHIVEKLSGQEQTTEVTPSLYGLRTAMSIAIHDVNLAAQVMINPIKLYNQVIFGNTSP